MRLLTKPILTWYEPPALAEVSQRLQQVNRLRCSGWKVLALFLVFLLTVLGPLPVLRAWIMPPMATRVRYGEGVLLALVLWAPLTVVYMIGAWLACKGVRLRMMTRCYARGCHCCLETGLSRLRSTAIREFLPVRIAVDQHDVILRVYTLRRGGAPYIIGFPDETTAARVDELLAAAGVSRGPSCQLTTWDEVLAFYQRVRSSETYCTWLTKRSWWLPPVVAAAMLAIAIVMRVSLLVMFFPPWQSSTTAMIIPAYVTGQYLHGVNEARHTSVWATFAVPSAITQAETGPNGMIHLSVPPCTLIIGVPRPPPCFTNYLAFAPAVLTARLRNPHLFHPAMTNLLASLVDNLQAAWLAQPLPAWRAVMARPTVFWAHFASQATRRSAGGVDAVTLVNTPHVNGIIHYAWEGSTARVAEVLLQDHERTRMIRAMLRVPPSACAKLPHVASTFAASFQFAPSPSPSSP